MADFHRRKCTGDTSHKKATQTRADCRPSQWDMDDNTVTVNSRTVTRSAKAAKPQDALSSRWEPKTSIQRGNKGLDKQYGASPSSTGKMPNKQYQIGLTKPRRKDLVGKVLLGLSAPWWCMSCRGHQGALSPTGSPHNTLGTLKPAWFRHHPNSTDTMHSKPGVVNAGSQGVFTVSESNPSIESTANHIKPIPATESHTSYINSPEQDVFIDLCRDTNGEVTLFERCAYLKSCPGKVTSVHTTKKGFEDKHVSEHLSSSSIAAPSYPTKQANVTKHISNSLLSQNQANIKPRIRQDGEKIGGIRHSSHAADGYISRTGSEVSSPSGRRGSTYTTKYTTRPPGAPRLFKVSSRDCGAFYTCNIRSCNNSSTGNIRSATWRKGDAIRGSMKSRGKSRSRRPTGQLYPIQEERYVGQSRPPSTHPVTSRGEGVRDCHKGVGMPLDEERSKSLTTVRTRFAAVCLRSGKAGEQSLRVKPQFGLYKSLLLRNACSKHRNNVNTASLGCNYREMLPLNQPSTAPKQPREQEVNTRYHHHRNVGSPTQTHPNIKIITTSKASNSECARCSSGQPQHCSLTTTTTTSCTTITHNAPAPQSFPTGRQGPTVGGITISPTRTTSIVHPLTTSLISRSTTGSHTGSRTASLYSAHGRSDRSNDTGVIILCTIGGDIHRDTVVKEVGYFNHYYTDCKARNSGRFSGEDLSTGELQAGCTSPHRPVGISKIPTATPAQTPNYNCCGSSNLSGTDGNQTAPGCSTIHPLSEPLLLRILPAVTSSQEAQCGPHLSRIKVPDENEEAIIFTTSNTTEREALTTPSKCRLVLYTMRSHGGRGSHSRKATGIGTHSSKRNVASPPSSVLSSWNKLNNNINTDSTTGSNRHYKDPHPTPRGGPGPPSLSSSSSSRRRVRGVHNPQVYTQGSMNRNVDVSRVGILVRPHRYLELLKPPHPAAGGAATEGEVGSRQAGSSSSSSSSSTDSLEEAENNNNKSSSPSYSIDSIEDWSSNGMVLKPTTRGHHVNENHHYYQTEAGDVKYNNDFLCGAPSAKWPPSSRSGNNNNSGSEGSRPGTPTTDGGPTNSRPLSSPTLGPKCVLISRSDSRRSVKKKGPKFARAPRRSPKGKTVTFSGVDQRVTLPEVAGRGRRRMDEAEAEAESDDISAKAGIGSDPLTDPVYRADCNDNTTPLPRQCNAEPPTRPKQQQQQSPTYTEMSPTKSVTASPIRCASRGSNNSDHPGNNASLNGILYSPEDTLNNDFFYDDEFSVPFDANLGENETRHVVDVEMLDSMDINTLLTLSRVYDDNQEPIISRLVQSKSDTCLYHQMSASSSGDMMMMMPSGDVETSGDQSMSDQCTSSADFSELRNEPLFSPPPHGVVEQAPGHHQYSTDSLGRDEPLSGSFTMGDEARYTCDWSATKGQYMLSFDSRGHRHHSDDDSSSSNHDSSSHMTSSLTSWAQKSRDSNAFMLWGSRDSLGRGSRDSLGRGALSSGGSTPLRGSPKHHPRKHHHRHSDQSPLTTWSKVKEDKTVDTKKKEKLTTWRSLRETKSGDENQETGRSKSLPDMRSKIKTSSTVSQTSDESDPREGAEDKLIDVDIEDECITRRSTTSLFELFQRLKSQEEDMGENMVSSATMHMLTGTWSMSPVSSEQSGNLSERSPSVPGLSSWNTMKDLCTKNNASLRTSTADSIDSSTPDKADGVSPANSLNNSRNNDHQATKTFTSFACNTSYHDDDNRPKSDAQCGSLILTKSLIYGKDNKDFCGQFPPNARDCSVQTSLEYGTPLKSTTSRSLQTSLGSSTESNKGDLGSPKYQSTPQKTSYKESKLHTFKDLAIKHQDMTLKVRSPVDAAIEPLKKTEPCLTNSLLFSNSALPDLSFLNKGMTQSISSFLEQAAKAQPIFNPRMVRADTLTGHVDMSIGREALAREKKNRINRKSAPPISRDSSPRTFRHPRRHSHTDSSSSTSVCSTSSSGIDSGCYESSQSHSPRGNMQYFSDLGLFSPNISDDSSTLSESSGSSPSNSRTEVFSMPKLGEHKNSAINNKVQDPSITRVKEVTSFAELANKQTTAVNKKLERQAKVEQGTTINSIKSSPHRTMNLHIPEYRGKGTHDTDRHFVESKASPRRQSLPEGNKTEPRSAIPPPKPPRLICQECQSQHNDMISSVPVYSEPLYKMIVQPVKQVEYLQVSPTHRPYHLIGIPVSRPCPIHHQSSLVKAHQLGSECTCGSQQLKKPLKSCLVKRRRVRKNLFKHRSYSDAHDLAIMKYSQEGQTRYQLIAPSSCEEECRHGLSTGAAGFTSLPAEVLQESLRQQVKKRLSQQDLPVLPLVTSPPTDDEDQTGNSRKPARVANSPDLIPVMPCPCGHHGGSGTRGGPASVTSHSSDDSCSDCTEANNRHKKSVSFSEEVFYHSPYNSPRGSPKKPRAPPLGSIRPRAVSEPSPVSTTTQQQTPAPHSKPVPVRGEHVLIGASASASEDTVSEAGSDDTPPSHFTVSPSTSPTPGNTVSPRSLSTYSASGVDLTHKKELVLEVIKAAEQVMAHFVNTRDPTQKMRLGSTAQTPEIGHLILQQLCPAIHAVLLDGLKPHVRSLFGRMRNSVWRVVEDSAELGPSTRVIHELVRDLKNLDFLSTNWLKVNAFIFGLLNHKALDFWLMYIHNQESLLSRHYTPESFLYLSATASRHLFLDMTTALQPLGQLPFRLEYQLEYQVLQQLEQKRLSDYLLDKHVANAEHAYVESQQALANHANMNSAHTKAAAHSQMAIAQALGQKTQQSEGLFQVSTKRLLGKIHTRGSLIESLSSVFPLSTTSSNTTASNSQCSDSNKTVSPSSSTLSGSGESTAIVSPTGSDSIPVMWNNAVLDSKLEEDSPDDDAKEGLLTKLTRQVKQQLVVSPDKQVYKRGVTEYQFDETGMKNAAYAAQPTSTACATPKPVPISTACAPPKPLRLHTNKLPLQPASPPANTPESDDEKPPGIIHNSNSDSGIDQVEPPPVDFDAVPKAEIPPNKDPRKRWSDTAARWMGMESGERVEVGLTQVKKRWSSFGSSMLKMFDKLLLDDPATPQMESPPGQHSITSPTASCIKPPQAEAPGVDWSQCETLVDVEHVLKDAPAGVQMWADTTASQRSAQTEPMVKMRRPHLQKALQLSPEQSTQKDEDRYVETLCALVSMSPDQLSFKQGQRMKVVGQADDDFLLCRLGEQQGLVHSACVRDFTEAMPADTP